MSWLQWVGHCPMLRSCLIWGAAGGLRDELVVVGWTPSNAGQLFGLGWIVGGRVLKQDTSGQACAVCRLRE